MKNISGAEAVIHCLLEEGVDILFGYPGGAIMPVYDELYKFQNKINHILVRHEQGATHAAQGYARSSGKVGVAIATSGPGATILVTGIADAQIDSTTMVCITGQVASSLLGSDAFQETDIIGISTPVTKWNYQITKASEISEIFANAFPVNLFEPSLDVIKPITIFNSSGVNDTTTSQLVNAINAGAGSSYAAMNNSWGYSTGCSGSVCTSAVEWSELVSDASSNSRTIREELNNSSMHVFGSHTSTYLTALDNFQNSGVIVWASSNYVMTLM